MVLEEKLKEYDNALYGSYGMGVIFVEKDNLYGIINTDGEEILDCQFSEYSDAYAEWEKMGFPNKPFIMTQNQKEMQDIMALSHKEMQEFKNGLIEVHNDLLNSGDIETVYFNENPPFDKNLIKKVRKANDWSKIIDAVNERLLVGQPVFTNNKFSDFFHDLWDLVPEKAYTLRATDLRGIAIDNVSGRIFLGFSNEVGVFDESGYQGMFFTPTLNIRTMDFNQNNGYLMISTLEGKGELFSPQAIDTLIETTQRLKLKFPNVGRRGK